MCKIHDGCRRADACKERQAFRATDHRDLGMHKSFAVVKEVEWSRLCVHRIGYIQKKGTEWFPDSVALRGLQVSLQRQGAQYFCLKRVKHRTSYSSFQIPHVNFMP